MVGVADVRVTVEATERRAAELCAFACRHLPRVADGDPVACALRVDREGDDFVLHGGGELQIRRSEGAVVEELGRRIAFHLVDTCRGALMVHGALVSRGGTGLLLPGVSGAGKSTLTAWLLRQGFALATDELVALPLELGTGADVPAVGLTRPVHLKPASTFLLDGIENDLVMRFEDGAFFHAEAVGARVASRVERLGAILLPRYLPAPALPSFAALSPANAARELLGSLVNARNLPDHGVAGVARVAQRVPCRALAYHELASALKPILDTTPLFDSCDESTELP